MSRIGGPIRLRLCRCVRFLRNVLLGCAFGVVVLLVAAVLAADRLIFHPPQAREAPPEERLVVLPDGAEMALIYLAPAAERDPVLLYFHGNAEDLSDIAPLLKRWHRAGFGVLGCDYPGYGRSGGTPSEKGVYCHAEAAWRYLTETCGIAPGRIVIVGFSVGSGPACYLAERCQPRALILLAPFTSAFQVVLPQVPLPFDRFPNHRRMPRIAVPVRVLHGTADRVIAPEHGRRLFELAPGAGKHLELLPGAGHNDLPHRFDAAELRRFLTERAP